MPGEEYGNWLQDIEFQTIMPVRYIAIGFVRKCRIPKSTAIGFLSVVNKMEAASLGFGA